MKKQVFTSDKYKKARGGYSRLLKISCVKCATELCYYQKDGPGLLKRMYLDRIHGSRLYSGLQKKSLKQIPSLVCRGCKELLGIPMIYKKENRFAFRLFVGAVTKKITASKEVDL